MMTVKQKQCNKNMAESGFTLIEVMISIVVALIILAGLMTTFVNQSSQYKYQNKRIDTTQDLEFGIKYIEEDLRSALVGAETVDIYAAAGTDPYTTFLSFTVWDRDCSSCGALAGSRALRVYTYDAAAKSLKYDREAAGTFFPQEILPNVTFFKVVDDSSAAFDTPAERSAIYTGMPDSLPNINIPNPAGSAISTPSYTVLIEMEVDAAYKEGSLVDVRGNAVTRKRVWRYVQVYPLAAVQN